MTSVRYYKHSVAKSSRQESALYWGPYSGIRIDGHEFIPYDSDLVHVLGTLEKRNVPFPMGMTRTEHKWKKAIIL